MFSRKSTVVTGLALFVLLILAALVILHPLFGYPGPINYARWLIWSRSYKAEVLAQPNSASGELKHIEWDGWGWAGMDTTIYLVFDPTNSFVMGGRSSSGQVQGSTLRGPSCEPT